MQIKRACQSRTRETVRKSNKLPYRLQLQELVRVQSHVVKPPGEMNLMMVTSAWDKPSYPLKELLVSGLLCGWHGSDERTKGQDSDALSRLEK